MEHVPLVVGAVSSRSGLNAVWWFWDTERLKDVPAMNWHPVQGVSKIISETINRSFTFSNNKRNKLGHQITVFKARKGWIIVERSFANVCVHLSALWRVEMELRSVRSCVALLIMPSVHVQKTNLKASGHANLYHVQVSTTHHFLLPFSPRLREHTYIHTERTKNTPPGARSETTVLST